MAENINIFDFNINESDMNTISSLNSNTRFNDPGIFCEEAYGTYCPIYDWQIKVSKKEIYVCICHIEIQQIFEIITKSYNYS